MLPVLMVLATIAYYNPNNPDSALAVLFLGLFIIDIAAVIYYSMLCYRYSIYKGVKFSFCALTFIVMDALATLVFLLLLGFTTGWYLGMFLWMLPFVLVSLLLISAGMFVVHLLRKRKSR